MEIEYIRWKASYTRRAGEAYAIWVRRFREITGKGMADAELSDVLRFSEDIRSRYASGTVGYAMSIIRDYASFVSRRKILRFDYKDIRPPHTRSVPYEPITPEEYVTLLSWLRVDTLQGARDNLMVRMLYDTGMRVSELLSLDFEAMDTFHRQAFIDTKKTDRRRLIFWGKDTNEFLKDYADRCGTETGPVFGNTRDGWRMTSRSATRIIHGYCQRAGIKKRIVAHSFRHSKAWQVLDGGGTVKDVQFILGHTNPLSSFHYLNLYEGTQVERARRFLD